MPWPTRLPPAYFVGIDPLPGTPVRGRTMPAGAAPEGVQLLPTMRELHAQSAAAPRTAPPVLVTRPSSAASTSSPAAAPAPIAANDRLVLHQGKWVLMSSLAKGGK